MATYYLTTTLPYVNSEPHIGFALEMIQADALARYRRLRGDTVIFNTGTDEHGLKIYRKAIELGKDPQTYCDEYAAKFDALKVGLNLSYTHFIRTTDSHHVKAAQEFWRRCEANGDIYKKAYCVKYCVGCELDKTESDLNDDGRCPVHPNLELEVIEEENYFFRFSRYQGRLLEWYSNNPRFVLPAHRLTEIVNFTEGGLEDFSISRLKEKMPWGVPVPGDSDHVMYVWFDALINYISTLGWPENEEDIDGEFQQGWPGFQIAGKDNLRQQSSMWQGMLLSAGIPMSRQILIHGFITAGGQKMSKSLGNVIDPFEAAGRHGIDALRFYLLKEISTAEDGDFDWARFDAVYEADLANTLGNLLSRVIAMTERYCDGKVSKVRLLKSLEDLTSRAWQKVDVGMDTFDLKHAMEAIWELLVACNRTVEEEKPWELAKQEDRSRLGIVLISLLETLRQVSWMISPFMPETSVKMRAQLGVKESAEEGDALREWGRLVPGTVVKKGEGLFMRTGC